MLNRRSSDGKRNTQSSEKKIPALNPAAFRQALMKYGQRAARFGREFAVISLDILEYEQVRRSWGEPAAEQLNNLGKTICFNNTRGADRLCIPQPGRFLILLPDSSAEGASRMIDRLSLLMASAKTHYKHKQLRASCSSGVAHSGSFAGDPEAMLAHLGYRFDQLGKLAGIAQTGVAGRDEAGATAGFSGGLPAWSARYESMRPVDESTVGEHLKVFRLTAEDVWSGRRLVQMRIMERLHGTAFDTSSLDLVLRRSKVLQTIDHPGVAALLDFHMKDAQALYLVNQLSDEPTLGDFLESQAKIQNALAADWAVQICNILIYLQNVMPPVVPPALSLDLFLVSDEAHLTMVDYEIPYLFPGWYQAIALSDQEIQAVAQGRPIAAYDPIMRSLALIMEEILERTEHCCKQLSFLFARLGRDTLPRQLNTIYKIRSALKEIIEMEKYQL